MFNTNRYIVEELTAFSPLTASQLRSKLVYTELIVNRMYMTEDLKLLVYDGVIVATTDERDITSYIMSDWWSNLITQAEREEYLNDL